MSKRRRALAQERTSPKPAPASRAASAGFIEPTWAWITVLIGVTLFAYLPAFSAGFIWDDDAYVTENSTLRTFAGLYRIWFEPLSIPQYYPLVHTTFWIEYQLWKLSPMGFHVVNVLLHGLAAGLLWRVLVRLAVPGAWIAAAVFALHPIEVESVAWITERKNVLSAVFYFASAIAYLRFAWPDVGNPRRWKWYGLALLLFTAALLSKTVTCSLPAALLLVFWWKHGRISRAEIVPLLPFFILGIALGLSTALLEKHHVGAEGAEWAFGFGDRLIIAGRAAWFYAVKIFWPSSLTFIYPRWEIDARELAQWIYPVGAAIALATLWSLRRRIGRGPLAAVLFFGGTLFPALGFIDVYPMRYSFVADHFQYLAGIGLIVLAAVALDRAPRTVPFVLLCGLTVLTFNQTRIYRDRETLWRDTLRKNPDSWLVNNNLGVELERQGRLDEAFAFYTDAMKVRPNYETTHNNLGQLYARQARWAEATVSFRRAIELNPGYAEAHDGLGVSLAATGQLDEAMNCFRRAIELNPRLARAHVNFGNALTMQSDLAGAEREYREAARLEPDNVVAHRSLAAVLLQSGRVDQAIDSLRAALKANFDDFEVHHDIANLLSAGQSFSEAIGHYKTALELNPRSPEVRYDFAATLVESGNRPAAAEQLREALRLKPDFSEAARLLNALETRE